MPESPVRFLGWGKSAGEGIGYPLQCSGLENSMDCIVHGFEKNWTWLIGLDWLSLSHFQEYVYTHTHTNVCVYVYTHSIHSQIRIHIPHTCLHTMVIHLLPSCTKASLTHSHTIHTRPHSSVTCILQLLFAVGTEFWNKYNISTSWFTCCKCGVDSPAALNREGSMFKNKIGPRFEIKPWHSTRLH